MLVVLSSSSFIESDSYSPLGLFGNDDKESLESTLVSLFEPISSLLDQTQFILDHSILKKPIRDFTTSIQSGDWIVTAVMMRKHNSAVNISYDESEFDSDIDGIDEDFDYWSNELSYFGKDGEKILLDQEKNEKEEEEMNEEVMDEQN